MNTVGFAALVLFAQRPPPDWQNSFWASPMGMLIILLIVGLGAMSMNRR